MDISTKDTLKDPTYKLGVETDSKPQAARILHAAGVIDAYYIKDGGADWKRVALFGGASILAAGAVLGLLSKDRVLAEWTIAAVKAAMVTGGAVGACALITKAYDALYSRWVNDQDTQLDLERRRVDLEQHRMESRITVLRADSEGRRGIVFDGQTFRDLDTHAIFTQSVNLAISPVMEQLEKVLEGQRAMARQLPPGSYHFENIVGDQLLPDGQEDGDIAGVLPLRTRVTLSELTRQYGPGSYHRLLLGETVDLEKNTHVGVFADMTDMVHMLISGATKWGKSTFQESLAKQLVLAGDSDLCFCDIGCNTFAALAPYALYPIADSPDNVVALFQALCQEMDARRARIAQYPLAKNLDQYNAASGDKLRPIVVFVDEASVLFDRSSGAREMAVDLARMGRKYGIGCAFSGTDFRAEILPTSARGNCGARFAFHLDELGLSRSIIHSAAALDLRVPGRAIARLPGKGTMEIQCPIVDSWADLPAATGRTLSLPVCVAQEADKGNGHKPDLDAIDDETLTDDARVRLLHNAGASDSAVAGRVWHSNPFYLAKVRSILADPVVVVAPDDQDARNLGDVDRAHNNNNNGDNGNNGGAVDWCEWCDDETGPFLECARCGCAVCITCANDRGICPDCECKE